MASIGTWMLRISCCSVMRAEQMGTGIMPLSAGYRLLPKKLAYPLWSVIIRRYDSKEHRLISQGHKAMEVGVILQITRPFNSASVKSLLKAA